MTLTFKKKCSGKLRTVPALPVIPLSGSFQDDSFISNKAAQSENFTEHLNRDAVHETLPIVYGDIEHMELNSHFQLSELTEAIHCTSTAPGEDDISAPVFHSKVSMIIPWSFCFRL